MKLNKSNIRKALNGWRSSGSCEASQSMAIDECLLILTGESELDSQTFVPIGGTFKVDRVTQSITASIDGKVTVFDFSD